MKSQRIRDGGIQLEKIKKDNQEEEEKDQKRRDVKKSKELSLKIEEHY